MAPLASVTPPAICLACQGRLRQMIDLPMYVFAGSDCHQRACTSTAAPKRIYLAGATVIFPRK